MLPLFAHLRLLGRGRAVHARHADTGLPTVIGVYDATCSEGAGVAELRLRKRGRAPTSATRRSIAACACAPNGRPSCAVTRACGNGNEPLDHARAVDLLELLVPLRVAGRWGGARGGLHPRRLRRLARVPQVERPGRQHEAGAPSARHAACRAVFS